ncbi:MAG: alpha-L-fucosidase [Proteiniphilum sp.]|nr:alpha-L-fucosidase [Proteiniphilum sp.]
MKWHTLLLFTGLIALSPGTSGAQTKTDEQLRQEFVDLRFGMFIHYNIPTYTPEDWPDPDASPSIFNPANLHCAQWAKAAKSANMTYGCLTTKHHSGFCLWDTQTTDYGVMNSPHAKDVVREYVDAFRKEGLKVMLYYSILDTHHRLRPGMIGPDHVRMVKSQIAELLTAYGEITALIIDGWDAPWSRISYDEIPFEDIYLLVKSLQPHCLVMDLNAAKYPPEALFYTDIKSYEQGAGQHISKEHNRLPALSCYPLQETWFWKERFPHTPVKSPEEMVTKNIVPLNRACCNFILNVAPNRDGLIDDNALEALKQIGRLWKNEGPVDRIPPHERPIISSNMAKGRPAASSWSYDMHIMDFACDDRFGTSWLSHPSEKNPWLEITLSGNDRAFNMAVITEADGDGSIKKYRLEYFSDNEWKPILAAENTGRIKIHRFDTVWGSKIRIRIEEFSGMFGISELGVYNERN